MNPESCTEMGTHALCGHTNKVVINQGHLKAGTNGH